MLFYESGEAIRVGDEVMEPVNGHLHGLVVEVLAPGSPEAHRDGFPDGGIYVKWQGNLMGLTFMSPGVILQPGVLWFVGRDTGFVPSEVLLLYRSAQTIEKGDVVMQPNAPDEPRETRFSGGEREGRVVEVLQPKSVEAANAGHPDGGVGIAWGDDPTRCFMPPDMVVAPDRLFFCCRAAEADSMLRYRTGRIVHPGDRVERPVGSKPRGDVHWVMQPGSQFASDQGRPSGGVFVHWYHANNSTFCPPEDIAGDGAGCLSLRSRNPPN